MKVRTEYQRRMTPFVWTMNAYSILGAVAIWYFDIGQPAVFIYFTMLALSKMLCHGFDAVHDSLRDMLNGSSDRHGYSLRTRRPDESDEDYDAEVESYCRNVLKGAQ